MPPFLPYAATPFRAAGQAAGDVAVAVWVLLWILVARLVYRAITALADIGRHVESSASGIADNLDDAGDRASTVPFVGDALGAPLHGAGSAADDLAEAGRTLVEQATLLSIVLAVAVSLPPILGVVIPWARARARFARRAGATRALISTPDGERLLALRALATMPLEDLAAISGNPLDAWRRDDPEVVHRLAAIEIRDSGLRLPPTSPPQIDAGPGLS